jgi:hypothetical protein
MTRYTAPSLLDRYAHTLGSADLRDHTRSMLRGLAVICIPVLAYAGQPIYALVVAVLLLAFEVFHSKERDAHESTERFLKDLVSHVESRDLKDPGHGRRVAIMSAIIARSMGLSNARTSLARRIGHLHDIGKVHGAFGELLSKPKDLTPTERHLVESHSQRGAEFVALFPDLRHLAPAILGHHENWDGTGYPHGLAEMQIPLEARIVRIADSIDAMFHDRPYRQHLSDDAVRHELVASRGRQYDPEIIDVTMSPTCWAELLRIRTRPELESVESPTIVTQGARAVSEAIVLADMPEASAVAVTVTVPPRQLRVM